MKQYITIEQLNELSERELTKLTIWMESNNYDCDWVPNLHDVRPFLSIGQMIEFLQSKEKHFGIIYEQDLGWGWRLDFEEQTFWGNGELCDILWEAVKEILKK